MDRNALTEQRRQTVIGLLKGMNIKKSPEGGFDKDDVYECMQQLCDLYEKSIEDLENTYESEIISLKDKYQKYDDNNELYISLIMEAKKSSNDIINQAKNEVETILNEGKAQVAEQEQMLEQMRINMDAEKNAIAEELSAAREALEAEKATMRAEAQAEKEKMSAIQSKYRRQINSMESEFMEIKTNILRTAGKIDGLKSQLSEDDQINWNVIDDAGSVDFPSEDIYIENTLPVNEEAPAVAVSETEAADMPQDIAEASSVQDIELPVQTPQDGTVQDLQTEDAAGLMFEEAAGEAEKQEDVQEVTLEDLMSDIEIDLPDIQQPQSEQNPQEEQGGQADEISFEGLEDLFKED